MPLRRLARRAALPSFLRRLSSDEYPAPALRRRDRIACEDVRRAGLANAPRLGLTPGEYWADRRGTAAGLRALNAAAGARYFEVPAEAEHEADVARACLGGDEVVIDVQTHFVADRPECRQWYRTLRELYAAAAPAWWRGLDEVSAYDITHYLHCVFGDSETATAVLTSAPGTGPERMLWNRELAGTRALFERLGGGGRLLHHAVAQPNVPGDLDAMQRERERHAPDAWKVYTLGQPGADGRAPIPGWWLDDEATGLRFLEQARDHGPRRVCIHKGIGLGAPNASPRDVGPAAAAFPEIDFLVYHSGYEIAVGDAAEEGPYAPEAARGTDRLVKSLHDAGIAPGSNVYAELGTTWFCLIRRPEEAAHVLGKLLLAVGEERVLWGSDSIWYGSPQPAIDAFRAFQIPPELRERHGYPELTPELKARILGGNAAKVYDLDLEALRERRARDDLAWLDALHREIGARGLPERA